jgi:Esterase-like activity of phytase
VLERDNQGADGSNAPKPAIFKSIYLVDTTKATNLLALPGRPYAQPPGAPGWRSLNIGADIIPVTKKLLLNFVPRENPADFPEKWEGFALGATEASEYRRMLFSSDNDFLSPVLYLEGRSLPFPRAQRSVSSRFLLFAVKLR